jgi:two-component system, chemotaxis family, response regulator Rcp1
MPGSQPVHILGNDAGHCVILRTDCRDPTEAGSEPARSARPRTLHRQRITLVRQTMTPHPAGERVQILLAEDNGADVVLIREALKGLKRGHDLVVVQDGEKAIDLIERIDQQELAPCPSLLLLDLNLPRRSGTEVLQRLRQSPKCGGIPVIVLTSSEAPRDRESAKQLRADCYFRKPSDLTEFMKIREVVEALLDSLFPKTE